MRSLRKDQRAMLFNMLIGAGLVIVLLFAILNVGTFINGTIANELINTYPLGQFESITASEEYDELYTSSVNKSNAFITQNYNKYDKCGVLIPDIYINQFNEEVEFNAINPIRGLEPNLKSKFQSNYSNFTKLNDLLEFFRDE